MSLSQAYASAHAGAPSGLGVTLRSVRARVTSYLARQRAAARAREELEAYSDRQLQDLGLSRADIPAVVAGTYTR